MSVYQRKSDMLWIAAWYESGKKKTRAFRDEQTARAFEYERLSRLNKPSALLTLGEVTAAFFRSRGKIHFKTNDAIVWLLPGREDGQGKHTEAPGEFLRDKYEEMLNRQDLERMREGFRVRGVSNATINKFQAYIQSILSWGADQELIARNPWRDFKKLSIQRKMIRTSIDDVRKVYLSAAPWLQWAIKTMYALTIRPGSMELFGLDWSSFDWRHGFVSVKQGKTGRIKTVYPPQEYLIEARIRFDDDTAKGINFVCHRNGLKVHSYRTAWLWALKRAKVEPFPMYNIRHVAVSEALASGADLAAVAAQAGHSSVATTSHFYAHVVSGAQKKAAALMPGIDAISPGTV